MGEGRSSSAWEKFLVRVDKGGKSIEDAVRLEAVNRLPNDLRMDLRKNTLVVVCGNDRVRQERADVGETL